VAKATLRASTNYYYFKPGTGICPLDPFFWAKQVEMGRVRFVIGKGRLIGRYMEEKDRFVGRRL
jgi:hypothetical protein